MSQQQTEFVPRISKGIRPRAISGIVFGMPGIGKTSFAAQYSPNTLIHDLENGSDFIDTARISASNYAELMDNMRWFKGQKDYDTIVIDSITVLEQIYIEQTVKANGWASIEAPGYGKGWTEYSAQMLKFLKAVSGLQDSGKSVLFVGHHQVKTMTDPTQFSYDRIEFHINKNVQTALTAAVDFCFYMRPKIATMEEKGKERTFNSGMREILTTDTGGALSKNRFSHMPDIVQIPSSKDKAELNRHYSNFWKQLRGEPVEILETESATF